MLLYIMNHYNESLLMIYNIFIIMILNIVKSYKKWRKNIVDIHYFLYLYHKTTVTKHRDMY